MFLLVHLLQFVRTLELQVIWIGFTALHESLIVMMLKSCIHVSVVSRLCICKCTV